MNPANRDCPCASCAEWRAEVATLKAQLVEAREIIEDVAAPWCDTKTSASQRDCGECPLCRAKAFLASHPASLEDTERIYPCAKCGIMRSKAEGGTTFTVCDACWDVLHPASPGEGG